MLNEGQTAIGVGITLIMYKVALFLFGFTGFEGLAFVARIGMFH